MSALDLLNPSGPENIVIFRARPLGALLSTVPAFRALRAALPDALITLVGLPSAAGFVGRFSAYLDYFISFPGYPGLPEQIFETARFPEFLIHMQKSRFDLAIQMHDHGSIANPMIRLWGAKRYAGFYTPGEFCPDQNRFLPYPRYEPDVWRHLRLMEFLGIPLHGDELEYPFFEEDHQEFQGIRDRFNLQHDYVCLYPGTTLPDRRWLAVHFAAVADHLASRGDQIVLIGTDQDGILISSIMKNMSGRAVNLAGRFSSDHMAILIAHARFAVSNDVGVSQIASAVGTPTVDLYTLSDPYRWTSPVRGRYKADKQATILTPQEMLDYVETHLKEVLHNVG